VWFIKLLQFKPTLQVGTSWPQFPQVSEDAPQGGQSLTIYITVLVSRGRHFGAQESVWSYFFEAKPRNNISKTDSRAPKWLPRSQKQCWIKLYSTFGSKMDRIKIWPRDWASISVQQLRIYNDPIETPSHKAGGWTIISCTEYEFFGWIPKSSWVATPTLSKKVY
jgi:hypothetical protein